MDDSADEEAHRTDTRRVRLRNGLGYVDTSKERVVLPPDVARFEIAGPTDPVPSRADSKSRVPFYVVDTPEPVAVLQRDDGRPLAFDEYEELVVATLLKGSELVAAVWIAHQAAGAAVAACYPDSDHAVDDAACGIWGVKALGGWDASPTMTFLITPVSNITRSRGTTTVTSREMVWVSIHAGIAGPISEVTLSRSKAGWHQVRSELSSRPEGHLIAVDVDLARVYNDAYGHVAGDLMLARVTACIERVARHRLATVLRVGGERFLLIDGGVRDRAAALAETVRGAIEALGIPLKHPEVATHGVVTVSASVVAVRDLVSLGNDRLRDEIDEALYEAKRGGRNRVHVRHQKLR